MKRRVGYLILFMSLSLVLAHVPLSFAGEDAGGAPGAQKAPKEVGVDEAHVIIEEKKGSPDFVILDVRTGGEYSDGHVVGAENIDVKSGSFKDELGKLDKSKTYLVYCRSGRRSAAAVEIMQQEGFTDIYVMPGGILGWQDAGYPVAK